MGDLGYLIRLEWNNPYTDPPNGLRVLAEVFRTFDDPTCREIPAIFDQLHRLGDGYGVSSQAVPGPVRKLSVETLAKVRKKRMERRIRRKYPLFADQYIAEELKRKSEYYNGVTRADLVAARDDLERRETERAKFLLERVGEVIVYGKSHSVMEVGRER